MKEIIAQHPNLKKAIEGNLNATHTDNLVASRAKHDNLSR